MLQTRCYKSVNKFYEENKTDVKEVTKVQFVKQNGEKGLTNEEKEKEIQIVEIKEEIKEEVQNDVKKVEKDVQNEEEEKEPNQEEEKEEIQKEEKVKAEEM
ncbi:Hypothetical_protein [Hexamita inflata]|uniref:Hypothetical_protein n=1 Tax=Hexamita inflata TaxID=28002 RepID=A0AA86NMN3_9EUKA|nr:Hypothetical protein HINF_LOCUS9739 [Hexamita inflata]